MLTLSEGQKAKAYSDGPQTVTLVRIETYSNHAAKTVDAVLYYATTPLRYRWDGVTVNLFRGFVEGVSEISRGFSHIPDDFQLSTRDGLSVRLETGEWGELNIWDLITSENLNGAKIEVATLLMDWGGDTNAGWIDQSAATADHIVRFRGEITNVPEYPADSTTFEIVADSVEPALNWPQALEATEVSEKHLGKLYPVPIGRANRVPLIQRQVGWVTTLVSNITATTLGNVVITDGAGLPASPTAFDFWLGTEKLTGVLVVNTVITITARGVSSGTVATVALAHNSGSLLIEEIDNARFVYSGVETLGVGALYARSPQSGELIQIPSGWFGAMAGDRSLDPGLALGVISFTRQLWANVITLLNNETNITVQPAVAQAGVETVMVQFGSYGLLAGLTFAINSTISGNLLGVGDENIVIDYQSSGSNKEAGVFWCQTGAVPNQTRTVSRFRVVWKFRIESNATVATRLEHEYQFFGVTQTSTLVATLAAGPTTSYRTVAGSWHSPVGQSLANLVNNSTSVPTSGNRAIIYLDQTAGGSAAATAVAVRASSYVEVELLPLPIVVVQNVDTTGAQEIGFNVDLFADVIGAAILDTPVANSAMDTIAGWTPLSALLVNVGGPTDGLWISAPAGAASIFRAGTKSFAAIDFTLNRFKFEYQVVQTSYDALTEGAGALRIQLTDGAGNWFRWWWPRSSMHHTGWREFVFDPSGSPSQFETSVGTLDLTAVVNMVITWESQQPTWGGAVAFRAMKVEPRTFVQVPSQAAKWLIEENAGLAADAASIAAMGANLPLTLIAGDLREAGVSFSEVLGRIGFEARTNFIAREAASGTVYHALTALSTYAFGASTRTLEEYRNLVSRYKTLDELPNEFMAVFNFDNHLLRNDVEGYRGLIRADATTNDISGDVPTVDLTDAQALRGIRPAEPMPFYMLPDENSVKEVFAYYVAESLRARSLAFSMVVPYRFGYDLEAGDIVDFVPPWQTATIKCRVTRVSFPFDAPGIPIELVEVL